MFFSYICSPDSGEFSGEYIRLGSRGDSYYEYLIKVWLQHREDNWTYLHEMYEEAMRGVRHLLVQKSIPNGLVFIGELPNGPKGSVSPKMDELVCDYKLVDIYIQRKLNAKSCAVYYLRQLFFRAIDALFLVKSVSRLAYENLCISSSTHHHGSDKLEHF